MIGMDYPSRVPGTPPEKAVFEQLGRILEKFRRDGATWVSEVDGKQMTENQMAAFGWRRRTPKPNPHLLRPPRPDAAR